MTDRKMLRCASCRFLHEETRFDIEAECSFVVRAECRKRAPKVGRFTRTAKFPTIHYPSVSWCGEHEEKEG